jgi:drug/metabolite transporter (DMT)-like permease
MSPRHIAMALMITVMTVWGSTFVVTKQVVAEIPPLSLSFIRVAIGALVLLPVGIYRFRRTLPRPRLPMGAIAGLSAIGVAIYYLSFNAAMSMISAAQSALVQSCIPAMTALTGIVMLRERATRTRLLGVGLSIAGVLIVFSGATGNALASSLPGNLLMLVSVVAWGIYTALAKRIADHDPLVVTTLIITGGALMLLPFALVEMHGRPLPDISAEVWIAVTYLGAVASGAAYLVYNYALRHMDAGQAGVFANLIPIVGVLSGVLVLHEPLSARAILGGCIVMLGVAVTSAEKPTASRGCGAGGCAVGKASGVQDS